MTRHGVSSELPIIVELGVVGTWWVKLDLGVSGPLSFGVMFGALNGELWGGEVGEVNNITLVGTEWAVRGIIAPFALWVLPGTGGGTNGGLDDVRAVVVAGIAKAPFGRDGGM